MKIVVWLTLLVLAGFLLLTLIPEFRIGGFEIKPVNILSVIRPDAKVSTAPVFANDSDSLKMEPTDSCKENRVDIEDYSSMRTTFRQLYKSLTANRAARIAFYGDSYIEGDILTSAFRSLLQEKYGGSGAGFIPLNTVTAQFRTTVSSSLSGWGEYCITDKSFDTELQGISGHYFVPRTGATASFACRKPDGYKPDTCSVATCYFVTDGGLQFSTTVNKNSISLHTVDGSMHVQKISVNEKIGQLRIKIDNQGINTRFFGISMENETGISVDNFSHRGLSGLQLGAIPATVLHDFDSIRHYDLIVLLYGLNVASANTRNYDVYRKGMENVIRYFRQNLPDTGILLISVSDRAMKKDGKFVTMPGILNLAKEQQQMAKNCEIAFWNLVEVMRLDGGIAGYVESKPSKARTDYTHINRHGGEVIAQYLFDAVECKLKTFDRKPSDEK
ncbi:MAG: hypothetical protein LBD45_04900 [Bacteroidales bacterium]|jgi:hypothetical protein|nr:hypothetical protein [Bacteroidales bacterium]